MPTRLEVSDFVVEVEFKRVKNINLRVLPPDGRVRVSAPRRVGLDGVRDFVTAQAGWVVRQRARFASIEWEPPRRYASGELHPLWGEPLELRVEKNAPRNAVWMSDGVLHAVFRGTPDAARRRDAVEEWYRERVRAVLPSNLAHWEERMDVKAARVTVRRMRTKWGSCSVRACTIRLNTELARKPPECFEYVLVHELAHLLEPSHNARFHRLMDDFMPDWRERKAVLDRFPMRPGG